MSYAVEPVVVDCPYCGEYFETSVDCSAGDQRYIEDCYVCCQPIVFSLQVDEDGVPTVVTSREDD